MFFLGAYWWFRGLSSCLQLRSRGPGVLRWSHILGSLLSGKVYLLPLHLPLLLLKLSLALSNKIFNKKKKMYFLLKYSNVWDNFFLAWFYLNFNYLKNLASHLLSVIEIIKNYKITNF